MIHKQKKKNEVAVEFLVCDEMSLASLGWGLNLFVLPLKITQRLCIIC